MQRSRRELLLLALGTGSLALAAGPVARVDEKDPLAVALGYVPDASRVDPKASPAFKAGSSCSTCSWYQGKAGDLAGGACTFFPNKLVAPTAWCRMWNHKT